MKNLQTIQKTAKVFKILSVIAMVVASLLFRYGAELEKEGAIKRETPCFISPAEKQSTSE